MCSEHGSLAVQCPVMQWTVWWASRPPMGSEQHEVVPWQRDYHRTEDAQKVSISIVIGSQGKVKLASPERLATNGPREMWLLVTTFRHRDIQKKKELHATSSHEKQLVYSIPAYDQAMAFYHISIFLCLFPTTACGKFSHSR